MYLYWRLYCRQCKITLFSAHILALAFGAYQPWRPPLTGGLLAAFVEGKWIVDLNLVFCRVLVCLVPCGRIMGRCMQIVVRR